MLKAALSVSIIERVVLKYASVIWCNVMVRVQVQKNVGVVYRGCNTVRCVVRWKGFVITLFTESTYMYLCIICVRYYACTSVLLVLIWPSPQLISL